MFLSFTRILAMGILLATAGVAAGPAYAVEPSAATGMWRAVDDKTGISKALVEITREDDQLVGKVVQILVPQDDLSSATCQCEGDLKGRPIKGLQILWSFVRDGGDWADGKILDPETGDIYNASLELGDGGKELRVRGYVGLPLFGRTQVWQRVR